jgi:hypothetical protein
MEAEVGWLRENLQRTLDSIEKKMASIEKVITESAVQGVRLDAIEKHHDECEAEEKADALEDRVELLEGHMRVVLWIGGTISTIMTLIIGNGFFKLLPAIIKFFKTASGGG